MWLSGGDQGTRPLLRRVPSNKSMHRTARRGPPLKLSVRLALLHDWFGAWPALLRIWFHGIRCREYHHSRPFAV